MILFSELSGKLDGCFYKWNRGKEMAEVDIEFDLIVTIVDKGKAGYVVEASKRAGALGGTILLGRGSGTREGRKIFEIPIEPEKR